MSGLCDVVADFGLMVDSCLLVRVGAWWFGCCCWLCFECSRLFGLRFWLLDLVVVVFCCLWIAAFCGLAQYGFS